MAFDYVTTKAMVRHYSALLADKLDADIQNILEQHAVPRIRFTLLNATDGLGNHVLYSTLTDLSDSDVAAAAELVLDAILEDSPCTPALKRIAAALGASWLILSDLSVLDSQRAAATTLEKQAMVDLDKLAKSPLLKSAAIGVSASVIAAERSKPPAILYLGLDADEASIDLDGFVVTPFEGAKLPFAGAADAGRASIVINGTTIGPVTVAEGDTPVVVAYKLLQAFDGLGNLKPNLNLMISERGNWRGSRPIFYVDQLTGETVLGQFAYTTEGAQLGIVPRNYEATIDVIVATFVLEHRIEGAPTTWAPGIKGLVYGINLSLSQLTVKGPHAVAADLEQGKASVLSLQPDEATSSLISDSFFFSCESDNDVTQANGSLVYQVNAEPVRTVAVPAGTGATQLVSLFAQDLAAAVSTQRVLGATRPSAPVTVNGTTAAAPSLELVGFGIESAVAAFVVKVTQVPVGIIYAVQSLAVAGPLVFDALEKSIVVRPVLNKPRISSSGASLPSAGTSTGTAHLPVYTHSPALAKILKNFGKFR